MSKLKLLLLILLLMVTQVSHAYAQSTVGKTDIGVTKNNFPAANSTSGSVFSVTEWAQITSMSVYFEGTHANHAGGAARALIYSINASGTPVRLVATSDEVIVADGVNGWTVFPFPTALVLPPASYLFAIFSGNLLIGAMDVAGTNFFRSSTTYSSGAQDPLLTPSTSTNQKSIYLTYTPVTARLTTVTWNVGETSNSSGVAAAIKLLAPLVDVVLLQEVTPATIAAYETAVETETGVAWSRVYAQHCADGGVGDTCDLLHGNGAAILSRWTISASDTHYLKYVDDFAIDWRVALQATLDVNGTAVNVFTVHMPAGSLEQTQTNKLLATQEFKTWAATFAEPKLVGGDFNAHGQPPTHKETHAAYTEMTSVAQAWTDSWADVGIGTGTTRTANADRIDFIFCTSQLTPTSSEVGTNGVLSDHYAVTSVFNLVAQVIERGFGFGKGRMRMRGK